MSKDTITIQDYINQRAKEIVESVFIDLDIEAEKLGEEYAKELSINFLAAYTAGIVYKALEAHRPVGKPKGIESPYAIYQKTLDNFADVKSGVQDAMAAAFRGAMSSFSGQSIDYYCQIKIMPEAINKTPC